MPGTNVLTTQTLLAEIGPDLSSFDDGSTLASWLGLCLDNRAGGAKMLSIKTRKIKHRAATALRTAAQSLYHSQSRPGHFYRRMRAKLGTREQSRPPRTNWLASSHPKETTGQAYDEAICAQNEVQNRHRLEARLRRQAPTRAGLLTRAMCPIPMQTAGWCESLPTTPLRRQVSGKKRRHPIRGYAFHCPRDLYP